MSHMYYPSCKETDYSDFFKKIKKKSGRTRIVKADCEKRTCDGE